MEHDILLAEVQAGTGAVMIREAVKPVLHRLFGDYQYWKVFCISLPQPPVTLPDDVAVRVLDPAHPPRDADEEVLMRMAFGGDGGIGFGLFCSGELVAVQWYWWGARYDQERYGRSWRLPAGSAKSVGLYTVPGFRGKGYAAILKRYTANLMFARGFTRLYSRIWHSHASSIRVSRKTGWRQVGIYIEIQPFARRLSFRLPMVWPD